MEKWKAGRKLTGRDEQARALRYELLSKASGGYVPPTALALVSLGLGDLDGMFHWFAEAIAVRDPHVIPLQCYPCLEPFRTDPRYRSLLAKLNLGESAPVGALDAGAEAPALHTHAVWTGS